MNLDDIKQILELVREHDLAEFELEQDGLKVRVRKAGAQNAAQHVMMMPPSTAMAAPAPPAAAAAVPPPGEPAGEPAGAPGMDLAVIKSPIVGTLYRSPEPGAAAFVQVGTVVKKGQVLCIIEAMKLMNEIESDTDGEIAAVYVDNGQPVQFGDRLFAIKVR
jgi:acetyl-CoA carboxylase biotin carboxyl carrier protein